MLKYRLLPETIEVKGFYTTHILHRIVAVSDIVDEAGNVIVKAGTKGGFVESTENLSQYKSCWVADNAMVFGDARVGESAIVSENAKVFGHARIFGNSKIYGNAMVFDNAWVHDYAEIFDNAKFHGYSTAGNRARIYGDCNVSGASSVLGNVHICGNSKIFGNNLILNGDTHINGMVTPISYHPTIADNMTNDSIQIRTLQ